MCRGRRSRRSPPGPCRPKAPSIPKHEAASKSHVEPALDPRPEQRRAWTPLWTQRRAVPLLGSKPSQYSQRQARAQATVEKNSTGDGGRSRNHWIGDSSVTCVACLVLCAWGTCREFSGPSFGVAEVHLSYLRSPSPKENIITAPAQPITNVLSYARFNVSELQVKHRKGATN